MHTKIAVSLALLQLQSCLAAPVLSSGVDTTTDDGILRSFNLTGTTPRIGIPEVGSPRIGTPNTIGVPDFDRPTTDYPSVSDPDCLYCDADVVSPKSDLSTTSTVGVDSQAVSNKRRTALYISPDEFICDRSYDSKGNLVDKRCGLEEPFTENLDPVEDPQDIPTERTNSSEPLSTSNGLGERATSQVNRRSPLAECFLNNDGKEVCKYYDGMLHPVQTTTTAANPESSSASEGSAQIAKKQVLPDDDEGPGDFDLTNKKRYFLDDCPIIAKRGDGAYFRACDYDPLESPTEHLNLTSIIKIERALDKTTKRNCLIDRRNDGSVVRRCGQYGPISVEGPLPISNVNLTTLLGPGPEIVDKTTVLKDRSSSEEHIRT